MHDALGCFAKALAEAQAWHERHDALRARAAEAYRALRAENEELRRRLEGDAERAEG